MQFAGTRTPVREIARTLDAAFVVEASIENDTAGIRAMVRLVNATTDRKTWVEEFHGRPDDLPTLSKNIAAAVSAAVLMAPTP
jgi:TolB-like protein